MIEKDKLVLNNLKLIHKCIKDMHCYYETDDDYQDLYDAGLEGLVRGSKEFDESKGYKESTFLYKCIKNNICRLFYLSESNSRKIHKEHLVSLDQAISVNDNGDDLLLSDIIADETIDIEQEAEDKIKLEAIIKALDEMENQKDALVIKMNYGLDGYNPMSLEEIAKELGVSRNAIWVRKKRTINKLKFVRDKLERNLFMENKVEVVQNNTTLDKVNNVLLEQLDRLKSLDLKDKEQSMLEIARSNATASIGKTILQSIGMQMVAEKEKGKILSINGKRWS